MIRRAAVIWLSAALVAGSLWQSYVLRRLEIDTRRAALVRQKVLVRYDAAVSLDRGLNDTRWKMQSLMGEVTGGLRGRNLIKPTREVPLVETMLCRGFMNRNTFLSVPEPGHRLAVQLFEVISYQPRSLREGWPEGTWVTLDHVEIPLVAQRIHHYRVEAVSKDNSAHLEVHFDHRLHWDHVLDEVKVGYHRFYPSNETILSAPGTDSAKLPDRLDFTWNQPFDPGGYCCLQADAYDLYASSDRARQGPPRRQILVNVFLAMD